MFHMFRHTDTFSHTHIHTHIYFACHFSLSSCCLICIRFSSSSSHWAALQLSLTHSAHHWAQQALNVVCLGVFLLFPLHNMMSQDTFREATVTFWERKTAGLFKIINRKMSSLGQSFSINTRSFFWHMVPLYTSRESYRDTEITISPATAASIDESAVLQKMFWVGA